MAIWRPSPPVLIALLSVILIISLVQSRIDTNNVYSPCGDASVQRSDGFTFGIAFATSSAFLINNTVHLSPCDRRLSLSSSNSQLAVFRPKVDEISLLTINASNFLLENAGGYMVAFAGRRYAARSLPVFVANRTYTVTSFTLVHKFSKGRLQNLYWKRDGCASCSGSNPSMVCLDNHYCAVRTSNCTNRAGHQDCSIGIQVAFSGTDRHDSVFNSWYEVENLRQYSLIQLYSNLRNSISGLL